MAIYRVQQNTLENFRALRVWQQAHQLVVEVYRKTDHFPDTERYSLVNQMRRAAVSVVANIVEGSKRATIKDRTHFHVMADGSLEELKYYFILSQELGFLSSKDEKQFIELARGVGAMLRGLTKSLRGDRIA